MIGGTRRIATTTRPYTMPTMAIHPSSAPTSPRPRKKNTGSSTAATHCAMKTKRPERAMRMPRPYRHESARRAARSVLEQLRLDHLVVGSLLGRCGGAAAGEDERRCVRGHIDPHHIAVMDVARKDRHCEAILDLGLDEPPQRTCAEHRIVPALGEPRAGVRCDGERQATVLQPTLQREDCE